MAREDNILVSAGAGSGKTAVLTERYFRLLDDIVDNRHLLPEDILTLTFTRKAAQEMRTRIALKFENEGRHHERRLLSRAPISTMHSFCESILRDYALAAGIDPNFRVLDEAEARTLQDNTLDTLFMDVWCGSSEDREEIARLLLSYQQAILRKSLFDIYSTLRSRGIAADSLNAPEIPNLSTLSVSISSAFNAFADQPGSDKWLSFRDKSIASFQQISHLFSSNESFSWDTFEVINNFHSSLSLKGNYKNDVRQSLNICKEAVVNWLDNYLDLESPTFRQAFISLLKRFESSYQIAKDRQGLLDFADLLVITRNLLTTPEIAPNHLLQRFRHILVDEFQDTNELQYTIITALRERASLFLVGDVKQAIYRFIGSDIRVFLQAEKNIVTQSDNSLRIPMLINYRTRPEIIEPLNALFSQLWPLANNSNNFLFEPLSAGADFLPRTTPSIEFAFMEKEKVVSAEHREAESNWIARRILQFTGSYDRAETLQLQNKEEQGETTRPATFADFMLLFQVSTDIPLYENALRSAGIPFYTVSGRGYYATREVQDMLYMLRVLENPHDDFAMAVVLRSPLAGISADALYWLTRDWSDWQASTEYPTARGKQKDRGNIWTQLQRCSMLPVFSPADLQSLENISDLINDLLPKVVANQPLDLIDIILDRTNFALSLPAMEYGEQRHANIQKLREVAATFQARGIFDLADFQRYLTKLNEQAVREATAPLELEGSNVVRLMTIHAAKGLQSPIVILADCGREPNINRELLIYNDNQITCKLMSPDDEIATPASYQKMQQQLQLAEREEANRLLYVALTRAEDYLICSGFTDNPPREKWKNYADMLYGLAKSCGDTSDHGNLQLTYENKSYLLRINSPIDLKTTIALPIPATTPTLWEKFPEELSCGAELPVLSDQSDVDYYRAIYDRIQPFPPTERDRIIRVGVHRALCYRNCPRQYWYRYLLKRDSSPAEQATLESPDELENDELIECMDGTESGSLLHKLMQDINFQQPIPEQFDPILANWRAEQIEVLPIQENLLRKYLYDFSKLPLAKKLSDARSCHHELSFLASEGKMLIPGIIDLLVEIDDGWWIIDYKTGKRSADHLRQLAIYAHSVNRELQVKITRLILVYFDKELDASLREEKMTDTLFNEAHDIIHHVETGIRNENYPASPGYYCRYCPALTYCQQGTEEANKVC